MRRRQSAEVYSFRTSAVCAASGQALPLMVHFCTAQYQGAAVSVGNTRAQRAVLDPTVPCSECKPKLKKIPGDLRPSQFLYFSLDIP